MLNKWLFWINSTIGGLIGLFILGTLFLSFTRPDEISITDPSLTKRALPSCAFAMHKSACDAIEKTFDLKFSPMTIQLPDFRNQLIYYGKNGRPDAQPDQTVLHFGFAGNQVPFSFQSGERLYLVYENKKVPGQSHVLSPNNAETPIWIEAIARGSDAFVSVKMKNENGEIIQEPSAHAQFTLPEKEAPRSGKTWEIGKWRVDGSLLARQKARWSGLDIFLDRHGGEEYKGYQGKHRIDFTDEEQTYSAYVGVNDSLIFENDRWKTMQPGKDSREFPLMVVKKFDDRLVNFELWDIGGKNKVALNLLKSNEPWNPQNVPENFKYMGARTRSQYIFEIDGERVFLKPKDWLLQTNEGWIKLDTPELIDDYVDRKLTGILFVFDGVEYKDDSHILMGVMFNASRTDMQPVELPIKLSANRKDNSIKKAVKDVADGDDDEDVNESHIPLKTREAENQVPIRKANTKEKQNNQLQRNLVKK